MAQDITNTYGIAKQVFTTLGLKEDTFVSVPKEHIKVFRKHLSEIIKRQKSNNRYASRYVDNGVKIIRIQ